LSIGYFGGLFGFLLDQLMHKGISYLTILGLLFGILVGATLASDGETIFKFKSTEGRFNVFYTGLRGIFVGSLSALIAFLIALIIQTLIKISFIKPALIFGFSLGAILGATNPGNLSAYSSYTSAWLKNIIVIILIIAAIIVGILIGILLKTPILNFMKVS
jgi:hypothetical protein